MSAESIDDAVLAIEDIKPVLVKVAHTLGLHVQHASKNTAGQKDCISTWGALLSDMKANEPKQRCSSPNGRRARQAAAASLRTAMQTLPLKPSCLEPLRVQINGRSSDSHGGLQDVQRVSLNQNVSREVAHS